jgi:predicted TIM-barrel fold metal-dependent hydrolase
MNRRDFLTASSIGLIGLRLQGETRTVDAAAERVIDIHQHVGYTGRSDEALIAHQRAMGATLTVLLPAGRSVITASTHEGVSNGLQAECLGNDACFRLAQAHPDAFRFGANEVPDLPDAAQAVEDYLRRGAVVIGEQKFGVACDSPEMQKLYRLADARHVPVLMHWQSDMYNYGFERFHKMLEKYRKVAFIGHAQTWWANIDKNNRDQTVMYPKGPVTPGGLTDRYLSDYPNMYGDLSAGSGLNALTRDEAFTRDFLVRHQDKLLFGSDCTDVDGHEPACQGAQTISTIRRLAANKTIERKLLYHNARTLLRGLSVEIRRPTR